MTVSELIEELEKLDPDLDVMMTYNTLTSTCESVRRVEETEYQFFGKTIPCAMIRSVADPPPVEV